MSRSRSKSSTLSSLYSGVNSSFNDDHQEKLQEILTHIDDDAQELLDGLIFFACQAAAIKSFPSQNYGLQAVFASEARNLLKEADEFIKVYTKLQQKLREISLQDLPAGRKRKIYEGFEMLEILRESFQAELFLSETKRITPAIQTLMQRNVLDKRTLDAYGIKASELRHEEFGNHDDMSFHRKVKLLKKFMRKHNLIS